MSRASRAPRPAYVRRPYLLACAHISHLFCPAAQLVLSSLAVAASTAEADACVARLAAFVTSLTLPAFSADLLSTAPPTPAPLALLTDMLHITVFDQFLSARPRIVHLALPNFIGVP
jgi:hypothetical protein